jgi:hypothetical protein
MALKKMVGSKNAELYIRFLCIQITGMSKITAKKL